MLFELVDLRLSQHAAISYQHHPLQSKLLPQLLDLVGYRRRISRVPRIDAHRHRTSLPIRHHSVDDDGQTVLPITVVSKLRERASQIGRASCRERWDDSWSRGRLIVNGEA